MWRTTTSAKALLSRESNAAVNRRRVCSLRDQGHRTGRRDSNPRSSLWQRVVLGRTELLPVELARYLELESNQRPLAYQTSALATELSRYAG